MKKASIILKKKLDRNIDHFLSNSQTHYLKNVLKVGLDENFYAYDGKGTKAQCRFINDSEVKILNTESSDRIFRTAAMVPFLKKTQFEFCLQKMVEVGVFKIYCYISEKSNHKFSLSKELARLDRYKEVIEAAFLQSENLYLPEIELLENIYGLDFASFNKVCVLDQCSEQIINDSNPYDLIISGGEYGFSKSERQFLQETKASFHKLGKNILKAETAPIAALAINNYKL